MHSVRLGTGVFSIPVVEIKSYVVTDFFPSDTDFSPSRSLSSFASISLIKSYSLIKTLAPN